MTNAEVLSTKMFERVNVVLAVGGKATLNSLVPVIRQSGHTVLTATDAQTAWGIAADNTPDLVILCADSLGNAALDLCKQFKADANLKDSTVLLVSTSEDPRLQVSAFDCGANDILASTRNEVLIASRVRALLKYRNAVRELRSAYEQMEQRVAERTAALRKSNEELKREMAERQKTEAALKTTEEMFRQIQKVEALGQLAGGVAHDFNNVLFVILGYCEVLEQGLAAYEKRGASGSRLQAAVGQPQASGAQPPVSGLQAAARQIRMAGERAAALTRQLLAFGRRQVMKPAVLDLNAVVTDMSAMLRRLIGEDVELVQVLAPALWAVKADRVQLEQVILNLAINARDAMPGGGSLKLETANVVLDEAYVRAHTGSKPGEHVLLAITDSGQGMDRDTQAHLFEPFFTTKGPGKGTGLGLAMAYGILKQSGGNIWAVSAPAKGTRFEIYLPRTKEPVSGSSGKMRAVQGTMSQQAAGAKPQPTITILLVEDEQPVRELTRKFLEGSGYAVLEARSCSEAIMLHERHKDAVRMLLTDVVMPKMSGRDLAGILTRAHPGLKVLYMSGYADNVLGDRGMLDQTTAFLPKPFTQEVLARRVQEVLAEITP